MTNGTVYALGATIPGSCQENVPAAAGLEVRVISIVSVAVSDKKYAVSVVFALTVTVLVSLVEESSQNLNVYPEAVVAWMSTSSPTLRVIGTLYPTQFVVPDSLYWKEPADAGVELSVRVTLFAGLSDKKYAVYSAFAVFMPTFLVVFVVESSHIRKV